MMSRSILLAEDDPASAVYERLALEAAGHRVFLAADGLEALLALEAEAYDLVICDLRMPQMDGIELLGRVRERWPRLPFLFLTAVGDLPTVVRAIRMGAHNYLVKPVDAEILLAAVEQALSVRSPENPADGCLPEIVGRSRCMVEARHLIVLAAQNEVNVLVTGETGTGKELAARAIHRGSPRGTGPFVAHNCAATPQNLFESELFGHVRGAFTGADRNHAGLLERADGGVLLLDELETLTLEHQAKLLRVLDDGCVRRIGGTETRRVSVRFVAATNRDAQDMVRDGSLRTDLYYRLRGYEVRLPALRKRLEDVPLLVTHFLGPDHPGLDAGSLRLLTRHSWPGNVRELRNVLEAARSASRGRLIRSRHLPPLLQEPQRSKPHAASWGEASTMSLREMERETITRALAAHRGNRTRAAKALGIDRSTLRRKIAELKL